MKYIDTNIFLNPILYKDKKAQDCKKIILKIVKGEMNAMTAIITWDELVFVIKKFFGKNISVSEGKKFLNMPNLKFVKVDKNTIVKAQELISFYDLNPRDAIHVAASLTNNVKEIISDDKDFDKIKEIKRINLTN